MTLALVLLLSPWGHAAATASVQMEAAEPERSEQEDLATAGQAFANGVRAYKEGRYDEALEEFSRAQALAPHPDTLFNVGLAQQRVGEHVDAWRTFDDLLARAEDDQEREEILAVQAASRPHVAWVRVLSDSPGVVCFDGQPLPAGGDGPRAMLTNPGAHRIDADHKRREVMLEGGEVHTVELSAPARGSPPPQQRRALLAMAGLGIGGSTAAAGLGLGAAFGNDREARIGLGIGAAAAGTIALTSTVVALVVHRRTRQGWQPPPPPRECP